MLCYHWRPQTYYLLRRQCKSFAHLYGARKGQGRKKWKLDQLSFGQDQKIEEQMVGAVSGEDGTVDSLRGEKATVY